MTAIKLIQKNPYHLIEIFLLIAGFLLPFSFAPYDLFWLQFPLLAGLFIAVVNQSPKLSFLRGLLFGFGWFAHGIHWIFYSLYYHGGSPVFLAVFIIVILSLYMSLFPAWALYFANKFIKTSSARMLVVVYPLSWMLFDWLRGYFLTGFPWMQLGVAHVDSYLSGFAPLIGGLGVGLLVTVIASLLALMMYRQQFKLPVVFIFTIYLSGFLLGLIHWTQAVDEPVKVSLIQGNIPQSEKWRREMYAPTLQMYRQLTLENLDSDLIVWPETAVPGFKYNIADYLKDIEQQIEGTHTDVLLGVFERDQQTRRYYNSVISLDGQSYKKRHLVPLGEYFPLRPVLSFFAQWIDIPMSDLDSGNETQSLITVAGQKVGISVCFEDAFDRGVLRDLPEATLLINVSNDAWFEDSPEPWQHHQIARMRAAETGRSLLRVTNTGVSSVIGAKGEVLAILPQFKRDVLRYEVQSYSGATPYVAWANYFLILSALGVLLLVYKKSR